MVIENLLKEDNCLFLNSRTKSEVLHELIEKLESVRDRDGLVCEIFYREQLMSIGIGLGIGIPHVRFSGVNEAQVVVGIKPEINKSVYEAESLSVIKSALLGGLS